MTIADPCDSGQFHNLAMFPFKNIYLKINIPHRQMTEKMSFEVDVKKNYQNRKSTILKYTFAPNALCNYMF